MQSSAAMKHCDYSALVPLGWLLLLLPGRAGGSTVLVLLFCCCCCLQDRLVELALATLERQPLQLYVT
jgi:hypothetical protein